MESGDAYCLHLGWPAVGSLPAEDLASLLIRAMDNARSGSDPSLVDEIRRLSMRPATERASAELAEIREASASAASVAADHARIATIGTVASAEAVIGPDYPAPPCSPGPCPPSAKTIMTWSTHGREQIKSYYCGAAATQMAALWNGVNQSQNWWWPKVKVPDKNEASLANIKAALNTDGRYQSVDPFYIATFKSTEENLFLSTIVNKIWQSGNPLIAHVDLEKQFFSYLGRDHGGHYQVIRGYDQYGDPTLDPRISIFEPYNEDTWWHNGYDTAGTHSVDIGKIFDATISNYGQLGA